MCEWGLAAERGLRLIGGELLLSCFPEGLDLVAAELLFCKWGT